MALTPDNSSGQLRELLDYDGTGGNRLLTDWEVRFIDEMSGLREVGDLLSVRMKQKLDEIWSSIFG